VDIKSFPFTTNSVCERWWATQKNTAKRGATQTNTAERGATQTKKAKRGPHRQIQLRGGHTDK